MPLMAKMPKKKKKKQNKLGEQIPTAVVVLDVWTIELRSCLVLYVYTQSGTLCGTLSRSEMSLYNNNNNPLEQKQKLFCFFFFYSSALFRLAELSWTNRFPSSLREVRERESHWLCVSNDDPAHSLSPLPYQTRNNRI